MNFHCYVHVTIFFFFFTFVKHNDPHTYQDTREEALSKNKKKNKRSNNNNNYIQVNTQVVRNPEHLGETAPTRNQRQRWTVLINPYIIVPLSFSLPPFLFPFFFHLLSLCTASDIVTRENLIRSSRGCYQIFYSSFPIVPFHPLLLKWERINYFLLSLPSRRARSPCKFIFNFWILLGLLLPKSFASHGKLANQSAAMHVWYLHEYPERAGRFSHCQENIRSSAFVVDGGGRRSLLKYWMFDGLSRGFNNFQPTTNTELTLTR